MTATRTQYRWVLLTAWGEFYSAPVDSMDTAEITHFTRSPLGRYLQRVERLHNGVWETY